MTAPLFIITTGRSPGARLSLAGHWGNQPHDSVEAAIAEARRQGGPGVAIQHGRSR